jgi:endonuclease/exonuclease/phosphatase family metal-dependent hydrolase
MKRGIGSELKQTLLFALLFLFFIQLVTTWIESMYRMSLIKLSPGKEMMGLLLLLVPLALLFVGKKAERVTLWISVLILLSARALCPALGAVGLIVVAGIGVAAFLIVLSYALSSPYRFLQGDMGLAVGIAVLLSVTFRSWGSSADVSMEGSTAVFGWLLVLCALYLFRDVMASADNARVGEANPWWRGFPALLGLFSNFTVIYLVLSSPAVVSAWSGSSYLAGTSFLAFSMAGTLVWCAKRAHENATPSDKTLLLANMAFTVLLFAGIRLHAPSLPAEPGSPPIFFGVGSNDTHAPLYLMFLLSPIVALNVRAIANSHAFASPRGAVLPVLLGMTLLFALTMLLIFSNVWGYFGPIGHFMRNKFYLPFLIAGFGMLIFLPRNREERDLALPLSSRAKLPLGSTALVLAALAIAGVLWHIPRVKPADLGKRQLTIMTYNMQQGSEIGGNRNYSQQLALLRKVNADIIGLQESDTARPSGGNVVAVRYFADGLGYYSYYGPNTVSGTFGTAILSRVPIGNPRTFFTFSDGDEVATAEADIKVGGEDITFFCNHPAGSRKAKTAHAEALAAEAARYPRVVSVGDYNFRQDSPWYVTVAAVLNDSWLSLYPDAVGKPHPMATGRAAARRKSRMTGLEGDAGLNMTDRIDHIFLSHNFRVIESYYLPPADSETDHPAHWAVVSWDD